MLIVLDGDRVIGQFNYLLHGITELRGAHRHQNGETDAFLQFAQFLEFIGKAGNAGQPGFDDPGALFLDGFFRSTTNEAEFSEIAFHVPRQRFHLFGFLLVRFVRSGFGRRVVFEQTLGLEDLSGRFG